MVAGAGGEEAEGRLDQLLSREVVNTDRDQALASVRAATEIGVG